MKNLSYNELEEELENLPDTWYPAMIVVIVKAALSRPIFQRGGLERLVDKTIREMQTEE